MEKKIDPKHKVPLQQVKRLEIIEQEVIRKLREVPGDIDDFIFSSEDQHAASER
ncbi:MAG: hypothetical protein K0R90_456 [Oscillospiraceae bacterium]|nr:hypothetical protein [Oscillospiraceae bacterium]